MQKVGLKILPDPSSSLYRLIQRTEDLSDRAAIFMTLRRNYISFLVPRSVHLIIAVGFLAAPLSWCQSGNQPLSDLGHRASGICIAVSQSCPSKATCWWLSTRPPGLSELPVETHRWCPTPASCGLVFTPPCHQQQKAEWCFLNFSLSLYQQCEQSVSASRLSCTRFWLQLSVVLYSHLYLT